MERTPAIQDLFNHLSDEHGILTTVADMKEIAAMSGNDFSWDSIASFITNEYGVDLELHEIKKIEKLALKAAKENISEVRK